jgi:shikimate dehydrogenase
MSPAMHNAVFEKLGLSFRYGLFDVLKEGLGDFILKAKRGGMIGVNVTIPHKVSVIPYVDKLSREASLIGAVNTIKFDGEKVLGFNTDGVGCVKALSQAGVSVNDKKILILGAGGAARAIGFQATLEGARVFISNIEREREMAVNLASEITEKTGKNCGVVDLNENALAEHFKETDVLIHATPVGMHPNTSGVIIPPKIIPKKVVVMDIVYNPIETRLLSEAKKKGCKTVDGVGMLVNQGAASEKIWLDIDAPVEIMREVVYEQLAKSSH